MMRQSFVGVLLLIVILLSGCTSLNAQNDGLQDADDEKQSLTIQLIAWNTLMPKDHSLAHRIGLFQQEHPNVEIKIVWNQGYGNGRKASWFKTTDPSYLYNDDAQKTPDIVELVPNQVKDLYRLGRIEPLNMNESTLDEYVITSNDGYVLGVKSKINPLLLYYNKEIFESLGIDPPSEQWGISELNRAIGILKAAGYEVYIPLSPYTMEWAASLFGSRIVGADGTTFTGYLDSEETLKAAKWLSSIGTKIEFPEGSNTENMFPYILMEGKTALAIEYAYGFLPSSVNSYEEIAQRNEQIHIAGVPRGENGINPAQISALSLTSRSKSKDLAMQLLRYLTKDRSTLNSNIATHTLNAFMKELNMPVSEERKSIVLEEMKRSVPATLYMHENTTAVIHTYYKTAIPNPLIAIRDGQGEIDQLKQYIDQLKQ
ncbi:extracellular solute-binding protein [Paenibacillus sp. PR3]|uniref:Extracellular solute-binding protein n=1 Tax=Paenibacillus terricola TaxID=2763503 RepID=A0ABR8MWJ3_9BACL|nr:extracellular solute-binding protein [Paenibacillus terricola]MBD3919945.1 extracellular solute-binding protein [Paenibacillus terricola]